MAHRVISLRRKNRPLLDQSGQPSILAGDGLSAKDPKRTIAAHCGNGFDAGFDPYQSARLNG